MDHQEHPKAGGSARRWIAVVAGAALAIPGGALVSNAFADSGSGGSGSSSAPAFQEVQDSGAPAPSREGRPDRGDCPEKDGSGSGSSSSQSAPSTEQTQL